MSIRNILLFSAPFFWLILAVLCYTVSQGLFVAILVGVPFLCMIGAIGGLLVQIFGD